MKRLFVFFVISILIGLTNISFAQIKFNGRECIYESKDVISEAYINVYIKGKRMSYKMSVEDIGRSERGSAIRYRFIAPLDFIKMDYGKLEKDVRFIECVKPNGQRFTLKVTYQQPCAYLLYVGASTCNYMRQYEKLTTIDNNQVELSTSIGKLLNNSVYRFKSEERKCSTKGEAEEYINEVIENVAPGDLFFLYMNGHGNVDAKKQDWSFVAEDSLWGGRDIVVALSKIAAKGASVRVIFDACYSGRVTIYLEESIDPKQDVKCLYSSNEYQKSFEGNKYSHFIERLLLRSLNELSDRTVYNYDLNIQDLKLIDFEKQTPGIWPANKTFDYFPSYDSFDGKNNIVGKSILPFWGINEIENKAKQGGLYALDFMEVVSLAGCALAAMTIPKTVNDLQDRIKYNRWTTISHVCASAFLVTFVSSAIWTNGELKTVYEIPKKKANEPHASIQVCPFVDSNSVGFGLALNF